MNYIDEVNRLISELKKIQDLFFKTFAVNDILSNSKIYEILIADSLGHELIPGHAGSRDARDKDGLYEYKHYKESSSNHTWTFNDFTETTIKSLFNIKSVIFAHINDSSKSIPKFDWYYEVPGAVVGKYLSQKTIGIKNRRKMVNVSSAQIESHMSTSKTQVKDIKNGRYRIFLHKIFDLAKRIESVTGTEGVLTSNKLWEILVSLKLGHKVLSEQAGHDAVDPDSFFYEYKVAKSKSWNFQDISPEVLKKYLYDKKIILAKVDKLNMQVETIYELDPKRVVRVLRKKLLQKKRTWVLKGKQLRRLQASLTSGDLKPCGAKVVYELKQVGEGTSENSLSSA